MANSILQMKADVENPRTGIEDKKHLAANVSACLSYSYVLMVKTQGYHWNVVGPLFHSVHALTEDHYKNLFEAIDRLGERVRALGYPAPTSITEMITLTALDEDTGNATAEEMLRNLIRDHEVAARRFRDTIDRAERANDAVTADLLTERLAFHEEAIWMLRALLTE